MEQKPNTAVELAPATSVPVPTTENLSALLEASTNLSALSPLIKLTAQYIELEKPQESFDGIFMGFMNMKVTDKATGELKEIEAARFLIDKQIKINAGVVLINELKSAAISEGTPIRVTYEEKKENTKIYSITLLG